MYINATAKETQFAQKKIAKETAIREVRVKYITASNQG
jgi:hypothetical protein